MCEECRGIFNHLPGCPNAPEPEWKHCSGCGEELLDDEVEYLLDEPYCSDCYCNTMVEKADPYFSEYIALHEQEYYKSWFDEYLNDDQRLEAYKMAYALRWPFDEAELKYDRSEFCFGCDDFLDYLKGRIEDDG